MRYVGISDASQPLVSQDVEELLRSGPEIHVREGLRRTIDHYTAAVVERARR